MKAVRIHEHGGPEVLRVDDVDVPDPGEGEARVRIAAAGLNFLDTYQRAGRYPRLPALPFTLGLEGAGVVDAVGAGVDGVAEGDRVVYAMQQGSYAEYAIVPAEKLVTVPDAVDLTIAAAAMVQGLTAHYLTYSTFALAPGMTALVHAAAGGTGRLVVQVAKRRGARVLGTCSREKADLVTSAGADEVIFYREVDVAADVLRLTGGAGVDVVYDSVGKDTFDVSLDSLKPRGTMVLYGAASGPPPPLDPQVLNAKGSLYLTRPMLGHYLATRDELLWRAGEVLDLLASGDLEVLIDRTWPLTDVAEAHEYIAAGKTRGKVLLLP